jgi:hypothetical protein
MIVCPNCNYARNPDDAYVCAQCSKPLPDSRSTLFRRPTRLLSPHVVSYDAAPTATAPAERADRVALQASQIAIFIREVDEPFVIRLAADLIMGRYGGPNEAAPPMIDFAPFDAYGLGVSRQHAMLRRLGPDVGIVDLGSTNGTWINGVQIRPHETVLIRSGDRVALARLILRIFLPPFMPVPVTIREKPATGELVDNSQTRAMPPVTNDDANSPNR